jgi:hypothetical protein
LKEYACIEDEILAELAELRKPAHEKKKEKESFRGHKTSAECRKSYVLRTRNTSLI